jgi:hypothetical protein
MKSSTRLFGQAVLAVMGIMLATSAFAQGTIPAGSKIYVEKMDGGLDGFLTAEIMKKKVPVKLVLDVEQADFVMTGASSERKGSWHEGWLSAEKDKASGSVMIFTKASKELVWAEEAGDRSLMMGAWARGGPRKVASRIADRLKDYVREGGR